MVLYKNVAEAKVVGYTEEIVHDLSRDSRDFGERNLREDKDGIFWGVMGMRIGDEDVALVCLLQGDGRWTDLEDSLGRGRKQGAMIFGGQFVARLVKHFGLLTEERLKGLMVIVRDLPVIAMAELEGDAGGFAEEALVAPRGGDEDEEMPQTREVLDSMASDFSRFTTWTITSLARLMDRVGVPYTRYSESSVEYQRCTRQRTDGANTSTAPQ
ncbi:hypothetical protein Tco_0537157 [Tanacetum coccineum]